MKTSLVFNSSTEIGCALGLAEALNAFETLAGAMASNAEAISLIALGRCVGSLGDAREDECV